MSTLAPRFVVVTGGSRARRLLDFVRAAARRSTWALWAAGLAALALLNLAREIGMRFSPPPGAPPEMLFMADVTGFVSVVLCNWVCLVVALLAADEAASRGVRARTSYGSAVVLACLAAVIAQFLCRFGWNSTVVPFLPGELLLDRVQVSAGVFVDQLLICGLSAFVYVSLRASRLASARRHAAEVARVEARRHTLESRLQAMQARVEPQFLFNTLAQVRALFETDAAAAGKMLDDLIAYLRAALPHLRESSSTLGKEAALARAYLEIVRVRLADRLVFGLSVPAAFAEARVPPMILLPLIDHALAHGAAVPGGTWTIHIETTVGDGKLLLAITDSGDGFVPHTGAMALDAMVERLRALYGDAAELRFERLARGGTQAVLEIPHETTDRGHR